MLIEKICIFKLNCGKQDEQYHSTGLNRGKYKNYLILDFRFKTF